LRRLANAAIETRPRIDLALTMMVTVSVLMAAHCVEIGVWATFYSFVGVTPSATSSFDFAFVNYTTLGYGDVLPAEGWRLIGSMTAMNGVLMFGWSTAVIFAVLRNAMIAL